MSVEDTQMLNAYQDHMRKALQQEMVLDDNFLPIYSEQSKVQLPQHYNPFDVRFLDACHLIARVVDNTVSVYPIVTIHNEQVVELGRPSICPLGGSNVFGDILHTCYHNSYLLNWKSRQVLYSFDAGRWCVVFGTRYTISIKDKSVVVEDLFAKQVCSSYSIPETYTRYPFTLLDNHYIILRSDLIDLERCIFIKLSLKTREITTFSTEPGVDRCVRVDTSRLLLYSQGDTDLYTPVEDQYFPIICCNYLDNTILWRSDLHSHWDSHLYLVESASVVGSLFKSVLVGYKCACKTSVAIEYTRVVSVGYGYPLFYYIKDKHISWFAPKLFNEEVSSLQCCLYKCSIYFDLDFSQETPYKTLN